MLDLMVYNYAVRCSVNIDMDLWVVRSTHPKIKQPKRSSAFEIGKLYR
jgi:dihydrodipicolinate synthase/N-acetylneuraminate lyase